MATETWAISEFTKPGPRPALTTVAGRRQRIELSGVLIDRVDLQTAVQRIDDFLTSSAAHQVVTVNLDFVSIAQRDARFRETINEADLAVADGMPLVWVSRLKGEPLAERITGVELVDQSCRLAAGFEQGVFLLGAAPGVAEAAGRTLETRYPGLRVVGTYSPTFDGRDGDEDERIVDMIQKARPDLLFVALGAPKQDLWIHAHLQRINVRLAMGVGCVLDLLAGRVTRAPRWMQRSGLEWSYRLVQEPGRLWRRYVLDDVPMLGKLVMSAVRDGRQKIVALPEPSTGLETLTRYRGVSDEQPGA